MNDKLQELYEALKADADIGKIAAYGGLKSYERPETLDANATSIVLVPVGSPTQIAQGSNTSLAKHFIYQVNIEATDRMTAKQLQRTAEKILQGLGFYQSTGGMDEYFPETKRYVDVRVYEGNSALYEDY